MKDIDHKLSREIVNTAKTHDVSVIKLERLQNIRSTTRTSRKNNHSLHTWSFYRLATFIEYKAKLAGIEDAVSKPCLQLFSRHARILHHIMEQRRRDHLLLVGKAGYDHRRLHGMYNVGDCGSLPKGSPVYPLRKCGRLFNHNNSSFCLGMSFWGSLPFYHKPGAFSSPILNFGACRENRGAPPRGNNPG